MDERFERALGLAGRHLAKRDRTVAELRGELERHGVERDTIEACVAELTAAGLLDDASYARRFAADRRALDDWGPGRIALRLRRLGVSDERIEAALSERGLDDEHTAAVSLLRRRMAPPHDERSRQRALGVLVRKGFELELAYDAVRRFERETAA